MKPRDVAQRVIDIRRVRRAKQSAIEQSRRELEKRAAALSEADGHAVNAAITALYRANEAIEAAEGALREAQEIGGRPAPVVKDGRDGKDGRSGRDGAGISSAAFEKRDGKDYLALVRDDGKRILVEWPENDRDWGPTILRMRQKAPDIITQSGPNLAVKTITANYTVGSGDQLILVNALSGDVTVTLPDAQTIYDAASAVTETYEVKKINATGGKVILRSAVGGQQVEFDTTLELVGDQYPSVRLGSDGSHYYVL